MATREEIAQIIGYLKLVYPNYNPDVTSHPNTIDVYEDLLGDIEADMLRQGVKAACRQDRAFAPSPGEIRAAVNSLPIKYDPMETLKLYLERTGQHDKLKLIG
jgi:hypothetical protein